MKRQLQSNTFGDGLDTDVSLYQTSAKVLITAKNLTQTTLAKDQFILQNESGTVPLTYVGQPVALTPGYVPLTVDIFNNIAYIISVNTVKETVSGSHDLESEYIGDGLTAWHSKATGAIGVSGTITVNGEFDHIVGRVTSFYIPPYTFPINFANGTLMFAAGGVFYNHGLEKGFTLPTINWPLLNVRTGYKTEIGTFPSPDWAALNANKTSPLYGRYTPLHNFQPNNQLTFTNPFRTLFGYDIHSEVDMTLQQSFDASINIIFTDGKNPIKLINSRFKPTADNPAIFELADRTDFGSRDTNEYSESNLAQTNLVFTLSSVPDLKFVGVNSSSGKLKEGSYKYYFKALDADGNETSIIEESRTVSIFNGENKTARTTSSGETNKAVLFELTFSDDDIENITGIQLYYTYFTGDSSSIGATFKLLNVFRGRSNNTFSVIHTGLESTEGIGVAQFNTQYTPVKAAKTVEQIRSRLALGNVTYEGIDYHSLAEASYYIRMGEVDIPLERTLKDVFSSHSTDGTIPYSTPEDIYGDPDNQQIPGIGYWRGETYVAGVHWVLENDFVTEAFPVKGIDRSLFPNANYTNEGSDTHDYIKTPFKNGSHENRLGVYRTEKTAMLKNDQFIIKKLVFSGIADAVKNLQDNGIIVKGYFFSRKNRIKDCLFEGMLGGLHRYPVTTNYQGSVRWSWPATNDNNNRGFFLPAIRSQSESWENLAFIGYGKKWKDITKYVAIDRDDLVRGGLKLVPSCGGWQESVNPHIPGYATNSAWNPIESSFIRDVTLYNETGSYDYTDNWGKRISDNIHPSTFYINRGAFHSAEMLIDLPGITREFSNDVQFETFHTEGIQIDFKSSDIGSSGTSNITKFHVNASTKLGGAPYPQRVRVQAILVKDGDDVNVEEQFSGRTDRNAYAFTGHGISAYDTIVNTSTASLGNLVPMFAYGTGKDRSDENGIRASGATRAMQIISTAYGSYFGCKFYSLTDHTTQATIRNINSAFAFVNSRFSRYAPTTQRTYLGKYTKVFSADGSLLNNPTAWQSLYNQLYGTYRSISKRYSSNNVNDVIVGEGDCFLTVAWKQMSRKIGLPTNISIQYPKVQTYYYQTDTLESSEGERVTNMRNAEDLKASGPLAYPQGFYAPLIHQNNNNVAVRRVEEADFSEKIFTHSDREYYPFQDTKVLKARPQQESAEYNFGLSFNSERIYTVTNINVPAINTQYLTRIVLSNTATSAAFINGYRIFANINYRDYNQDYGSITKLQAFNNKLYCIQETAISLVGVDDRTLVTSSDSGQIFTNSAELLPTTLSNINSEYGSTEFYSILKTDIGIFGVDYSKNRPWYISDNGVMLISEYKTQALFNQYKENITNSGKGPYVKTHFDRISNKVFFNYGARGVQTFTDQMLVFNTNNDIWVSELEYTPAISFTLNDTYYSISKFKAGIWAHNQNDKTEFYGELKKPVLEYVMTGSNISVQKILDNLKIVSNNVPPETVAYTFEPVITHNADGQHIEKDFTFTEPTITRGAILTNSKGQKFNATIMQANTMYKENLLDIQVGKKSIHAAKVRDKVIKVKLTYTGDEKVTIQKIFSYYRESFA